MKVYPIFLNNLAGRRCIIFGTGHEADRKARGLVECEADVTVITPELSEGLRALFDQGQIAWRARAYRPGDLKHAFLAIATDPHAPFNKALWEEAEAEKVLLNAMDDIPHCSFVAGSVVQRGPLVISISTSGSAPAFSVRLRQQFERQFGPEYGEFLEHMKRLRPEMAERFTEFEERRERWYRLIDSDLIDHLRRNDRRAFDQQVAAILEA
jgi:siroheme synthase-like protein